MRQARFFFLAFIFASSQSDEGTIKAERLYVKSILVLFLILAP